MYSVGSPIPTLTQGRFAEAGRTFTPNKKTPGAPILVVKGDLSGKNRDLRRC